MCVCYVCYVLLYVHTTAVSLPMHRTEQTDAVPGCYLGTLLLQCCRRHCCAFPPKPGRLVMFSWNHHQQAARGKQRAARGKRGKGKIGWKPETPELFSLLYNWKTSPNRGWDLFLYPCAPYYLSFLSAGYQSSQTNQNPNSPRQRYYYCTRQKRRKKKKTGKITQHKKS